MLKASDFGQPTPPVRWVYALSDDGSNGDGVWTDYAADRESAITAALEKREEDGHDGEFVYIAPTDEHCPSFDPEDIIETLACRAQDQCGEVAEGWPSATKEEASELKSAIKKVVGDWLTKTNNWPRFCEIGRIEKIPVPKEPTQ